MDARFHIAGLTLALRGPDEALEALDEVYREFGRRSDAFVADRRNPHLCCAGCSHCCKRGAFFALTLVEAVRLSTAVQALPDQFRARVTVDAEHLIQLQQRIFAEVAGPPDLPGDRDEEHFSARVSKVAASGPACPLLDGDLCGVYSDRPLLCRAYGLPVDAYAVQDDSAIVFRSLCHLYAGMQLQDYVRAQDLRGRVLEISNRLADCRGRFTSAEAILARAEP
ncbi:MAG TPA: YkgJ family cysteine cluster protein, partial [Phycisphaerae bacterium]|jgi:Fe-S-cluster containining protein